MLMMMMMMMKQATAAAISLRYEAASRNKHNSSRNAVREGEVRSLMTRKEDEELDKIAYGQQGQEQEHRPQQQQQQQQQEHTQGVSRKQFCMMFTVRGTNRLNTDTAYHTFLLYYTAR